MGDTVLVVVGGGREHVLASAPATCPHVDEVGYPVSSSEVWA